MGFGSLGAWEIAVIAVVVVLLFGTKKLPELGSGVGKAIANFRKSFKDEEKQLENKSEDNNEVK